MIYKKYRLNFCTGTGRQLKSKHWTRETAQISMYIYCMKFYIDTMHINYWDLIRFRQGSFYEFLHVFKYIPILHRYISTYNCNMNSFVEEKYKNFHELVLVQMGVVQITQYLLKVQRNAKVVEHNNIQPLYLYAGIMLSFVPSTPYRRFSHASTHLCSLYYR